MDPQTCLNLILEYLDDGDPESAANSARDLMDGLADHLAKLAAAGQLHPSGSLTTKRPPRPTPETRKVI
jgi:hypothetical protein